MQIPVISLKNTAKDKFENELTRVLNMHQHPICILVADKFNEAENG